MALLVNRTRRLNLMPAFRLSVVHSNFDDIYCRIYWVCYNHALNFILQPNRYNSNRGNVDDGPVFFFNNKNIISVSGCHFDFELSLSLRFFT